MHTSATLVLAIASALVAAHPAPQGGVPTAAPAKRQFDQIPGLSIPLASQFESALSGIIANPSQLASFQSRFSSFTAANPLPTQFASAEASLQSQLAGLTSLADPGALQSFISSLANGFQSFLSGIRGQSSSGMPMTSSTASSSSQSSSSASSSSQSSTSSSSSISSSGAVEPTSTALTTDTVTSTFYTTFYTEATITETNVVKTVQTLTTSLCTTTTVVCNACSQPTMRTTTVTMAPPTTYIPPTTQRTTTFTTSRAPSPPPPAYTTSRTTSFTTITSQPPRSSTTTITRAPTGGASPSYASYGTVLAAALAGAVAFLV